MLNNWNFSRYVIWWLTGFHAVVCDWSFPIYTHSISNLNKKNKKHREEMDNQFTVQLKEATREWTAMNRQGFLFVWRREGMLQKLHTITENCGAWEYLVFFFFFPWHSVWQNGAFNTYLQTTFLLVIITAQIGIFLAGEAGGVQVVMTSWERPKLSWF